MTDLTKEGASDAPFAFCWPTARGGHGAPFLAELSRPAGGAGYRGGALQLPYMTKRAQDGKRRPPDRQPVLLAHWREMVRQFAHPRLFLAGKSMGGRWRPSCFARGRQMDAAGLIVLGYPFHPRPSPTHGGARCSS